MLKAGIIGMGRMGITHFSIINAHPRVRVVSVCDQSKTMLKFFDKYVGTRTFTEPKRMMRESDLDLVIVATPTDSHADIIKMAIDHNHHIFVEKPFTMNAREGKEIIGLMDGKPLINQVGYVNRFNEVFMKVKELVDSKIVGETKHFTFEMIGNTVLKDSTSSWRSKKNLGGGCMYEFAAHCIDLVTYLIGEPDKTVGSVLQSIYSSHVEDLLSTTFVYEKGCVGNILVNWSDATCRKPVNRIEIFGKKGKIMADKHAYKVYLTDPCPSHGFHEGWNTRYITDFAKNVHFYVRGNEFSYQLQYFIDCIQQNHTDNISGFTEALKTDVIIENIFNDAVWVRKNG